MSLFQRKKPSTEELAAAYKRRQDRQREYQRKRYKAMREAYLAEKKLSETK